jgi:hypothetical protein
MICPEEAQCVDGGGADISLWWIENQMHFFSVLPHDTRSSSRFEISFLNWDGERRVLSPHTHACGEIIDVECNPLKRYESKFSMHLTFQN